MKTLSETITHHPLFHGMKPEHLALLTEGARAAQFKTGEILFREGEPANQFFMIEAGRVAVETKQESGTLSVQTVGPGEVLGWSWLFPPFTWHFQARALEPVEAVVLSGAHLLITAEGDDQFGYELMKRVARLVIQRLQATRKRFLALQLESTRLAGPPP